MLMLLINSISYGQDVPLHIQQQLENLAEATNSEQLKDDSYIQTLIYFQKHPINLNTATPEELQALHLLTELQIQYLLEYRKLNGKLINIYELQAIPGWDITTINKVLPYIIVGAAVSAKDDFFSRFRGKQNLLFRVSRVLEKAKGYTSTGNHYLGDPNSLFLRYSYQYKDLLQFGLVADKDPGEQFFKGAESNGFDFYSLHFFARRLGPIKALAVGDYTVSLGQGLIQWQSFGFGKSSDVIGIERQAPVLSPYRSSGEYNFNRGIGITIQKQKLEATVFASLKKISSNLISDTTDFFTSISTSGLYRTPSEIGNRNNIHLSSCGGNLSYQATDFRLGINTVVNQFSIPFQKRDEPYNYYALKGKTLFNSSIDYKYTYKNVHLFGEGAIDKDQHMAVVSGAIISVDPKVDLCFLYRNISKAYESLYSNAFTENSVAVNEKGFYSGIVLHPVSTWQLRAYADLYQFPWLKYRVNAPTRGYDYLIQLDYQPYRQFGLYLRYRNGNKPLDGSDSIINYPVSQVRKNVSLQMVNQVNRALTVKSRLEMLWLEQDSKPAGQGCLAFIECRYIISRALRTDARLQYFETDGYNSRIYTYESDVLYSLSLPAFYGKGFRYYLNVSYGIGKKTDFSFRWSQTIYEGQKQIGSGLDLISGNKKTGLELQLSHMF